MRITIITVGSRGDVQPYVALGLGLKAAGHQVRLATDATFEEMIRSRGLDCHPVEGNPREILDSEEGQALMRTGSNPLAAVDRIFRILRPRMLSMVSDAWDACQGTDAVIFSTFGFFAAQPVAEKMGLPSIPAYLQPVSPTGAFPSTSLPSPIHLGAWYNRLTYAITNKILWRFCGRALNEARQQVLGLAPIPREPFTAAHRQRFPILYGWSPSVLPKPADWGDWLNVTGYWFLDTEAGWQPPGQLVDFLEAGPPPVYVGFGSMNNRNAEETTDTVLKALAIAKQRGILVTGWGGLSVDDLPDNVFKVDAIPHDWLFPRVSAVVHHAGIGTTAAGLRAGAPTIAVPFFGDQPFWAERAFKLGVGPRPIPRKKLSAERLAEAISIAVSDAGMRSRAADLGKRIRAEDGVAGAVEAFTNHIRDRGYSFRQN